MYVKVNLCLSVSVYRAWGITNKWTFPRTMYEIPWIFLWTESCLYHPIWEIRFRISAQTDKHQINSQWAELTGYTRYTFVSVKAHYKHTQCLWPTSWATIDEIRTALFTLMFLRSEVSPDGPSWDTLLTLIVDMINTFTFLLRSQSLLPIKALNQNPLSIRAHFSTVVIQGHSRTV